MTRWHRLGALARSFGKADMYSMSLVRLAGASWSLAWRANFCGGGLFLSHVTGLYGAHRVRG
jgi:hypothetical protein